MGCDGCEPGFSSASGLGRGFDRSVGGLPSGSSFGSFGSFGLGRFFGVCGPEEDGGVCGVPPEGSAAISVGGVVPPAPITAPRWRGPTTPRLRRTRPGRSHTPGQCITRMIGFHKTVFVQISDRGLRQPLRNIECSWTTLLRVCDENGRSRFATFHFDKRIYMRANPPPIQQQQKKYGQ